MPSRSASSTAARRTRSLLSGSRGVGCDLAASMARLTLYVWAAGLDKLTAYVYLTAYAYSVIPAATREGAMFTSDPYDILVIAHDHARVLRAEQAAERLRPASRALRPVAVLLRWVADRLDPAPLAHRPA